MNEFTFVLTLYRAKEDHDLNTSAGENDDNDICNKAQAIYYIKNKERISQRKKEWYKRKKAEKLAAEKCENGKV